MVKNRHVKPQRLIPKQCPKCKSVSIINCDRGTREGFRRYWEANPVHFAQLFPGMTVGEAWKSLGTTTLSGFVRGI